MFLKTLGAALAALTLAAACGPGARATLTPVQGDAFLGPADAKVTVIEYGAPTCPGCKAWHDSTWEQLKTIYVDSSKIKFIFREFPSHNPPVDKAIFAIARCAGTEDWFSVIDEAFARQMDIERASRSNDGPMNALKSLGEKFRLSGDQVTKCVDDKDIIRRVRDSQAEGFARGVDSTPTFFVNDAMVDNPTFSELSRLIEQGLTAGALAPATTPTETPAAPAPEPKPGDQH